MYYTYLHCKPDGTPFYVGKGKGRRAIRVMQKRNPFHSCIVQKYGKDNIGVFIFPCASEEQALSDEIQQIAQLRREGYKLANFNDGGEGNRNMPLEGRMKISAANTGNKYALGFKHSDETRKLMSESAKKRGVSKEVLDKLHRDNVGNKSRTGQKQGAEEIEKRRLTLLGNKRCLGHIVPDEVKMKISESVKKARKEKFWSSGSVRKPRRVI